MPFIDVLRSRSSSKPRLWKSMKFIDLHVIRCSVVSMRSEIDHRQLSTVLEGYDQVRLTERHQAVSTGNLKSYMWFISPSQQFLFPLNSKNEEKLVTMFKQLTGSSSSKFHCTIPIMMGRELTVPVSNKGVCWFTFADLCERDKGAADYVSVSQHYHTVILQNVPKLNSARKNHAKRFITLIDELYEHKTRLICSCEVGSSKILPRFFSFSEGF